MGLFGKEKTSKDYLKEIAESQKSQARSSKLEALGSYEEASARASVASAEAKAIREENHRQANRATKMEYKECLEELQKFYKAYDFDPNSADDIAKKSMSMISWLDTLDRTFKDKKSEFYFNDQGYKVDNDSKSKEQTMMKKLILAVERLKELDQHHTNFEYIESKLKFYLDRQEAEVEAARIKQKKRIALTLKIIGIVFAILACTGAIIAFIATRPDPKKNGDDCKEKVMELVEQNDLYNAGKVLLAYEGWKYDNSYEEASRYLVNKLLKADRVDEAIEINSQTGAGLGHSIGIHLIKQGLYNQAAEYFTLESNVVNNDIYYYSKLCITDMCEKEEFNKARKFIKRYVQDVYNPSDYIETMNAIINSYQ